MKYLLALCLFGLVVAQVASTTMTEEELNQQVAQGNERAARILASLNKFKKIGLQQITKLRDLILANQHCEALQGITAPEIPTAPPTGTAAPAPEGDTMTAEEATAALRRISQTLTQLEHKIARMTHVGKTQIDIFSRFAKATGGKLCEDDEEGDD